MIHELKALVEEVQHEICDDYCKYPNQCRSQEEMHSICGNCPLEKLD